MSTGSKPEQDLALVRRALAGDARARGEFIDRMRVVGRVLAARNAQRGRPLNGADLEDLTQDVLLVAWRKLKTYRGDASLESWVYGIAAFELLNALRRKGKLARDEALSEAIVEEAAGPSADPRDAEAPGLARFLRHLAPREAEVVRLRHQDGLTLKEVGLVIGLSSSSVKTHYYRGLDKLRDVLGPGQGEV